MTGLAAGEALALEEAQAQPLLAMRHITEQSPPVEVPGPTRRYRALGLLSHRDSPVQPGETVELTETQAATLLALGVAAPLEEAPDTREG